jgi:hypothetical protein
LFKFGGCPVVRGHLNNDTLGGYANVSRLLISFLKHCYKAFEVKKICLTEGIGAKEYFLSDSFFISKQISDQKKKNIKQGGGRGQKSR